MFLFTYTNCFVLQPSTLKNLLYLVLQFLLLKLSLVIHPMGNLQSSPSSSTTLQEKYDVFLNFRGEDTRDGFTNNLYEALLEKKIETFIDNQLPKGDRISQALIKAIEESKISIIIFSKDYASSKWCLRELVKIMECYKKYNQIVIPVFYRIDPSDVRNQTGSFKDFFVNHEKKFPDEVKKWRDVLTEASELGGWDSSVMRPDTKLVQAIVDVVCKKLAGEYTLSPSDFKGLIGLDKRIKQVKSLLCLHMTDVRIIGIWGMGGIGKTTLAEAIFNQISGHQFEGVCLIHNIREKLENSGGLDCLQKNILSEVLKDKNLELDSPSTIPPTIKKRLNQTKVFIVLDDVDDFIPLETLARRVDGLGQGSRIIITSRNKLVLQNCRVDDQNIYGVEEFNHHEALQLFCNYAFNQNHPTEDLNILSNDIVNYVNGNPLALKVLGSSLKKKSKEVWESAVNKLRTNVCKIFDILKISYDELYDGEQEVFLDIACFLKGENLNYVASILDNRRRFLDALIDKSLITVSWGTIEMHDLLQDLGREIVLKEYPNNPGQRSRLWRPEDVEDLLKHGVGTDAVQGIYLDMFKIKDMHLRPKAFKKMRNLRLLKFYDSTCSRKDLQGITHVGDSQYNSKVLFREGLNNDHFDKLTSFNWLGYPLTALPSNFYSENLVELDLSYSSNLKRLWANTMDIPKLKWLVLNGCQHLIEVPDLSKSTSLEKICLDGCSRLTKIQNLSNLALLEVIDLHGCSCLTEIPDLSGSPSLKMIDLQDCRSLLDFPLLAPRLNCLPYLNVLGCKSLRSFPSNIHFESLTSLDLSSCIQLTTFPQISGNLSRLDLSGTAIDEVPQSIVNLTNLYFLGLPKSTRLISTNICKLKSLKELNLENCSQLESFPEISDKMEGLEILNLSGTAIKELPYYTEHLTKLSELHLSRCKNLELLPKSMKQLYKLKSLKVDNCNMLRSLTDLPSALNYLLASGCNQLQSIPVAYEFANLNMLNLEETAVKAEFIFTNCLNLEETAVGNMLATLKEVYEGGISELTFCCPGSKVPEWFMYRTEGSIFMGVFMFKTQFKMPWHDRFNGRPLVGFVVCAVIIFEKYYIKDDLCVRYKYKCIDGDESSPNNITVGFSTSRSVFGRGYIRVGSTKGTLIDTEHIAFGFCKTSVPQVRESDFANCTFEFGLTDEKSPNCRMKSFGVCPIYMRQNITLPSSKKQKT